VLLALALFALGCWIAFDRWVAGDGAEWFGYGLGGVAWHGLGLLGFAWCVSRVAPPLLGWRAILLLVLVYLPWALSASVLLQHWLPEQLAPWCDAGLAVLGLLLLGVLLRRDVAGGVVRVLAVATLYLLAFGALSVVNGISASVWYPVDADAADADAAEPLEESNERLLYAQPARLEAALQQLAPRVAGRPNLFFVGFAGFGDQRVFAEEIRFAAQSIAQRYGSGTRTLTLVNDRRDQAERPLATVVALEQALQGVAQRMDLDQDVLFLVLSSHGSADPELAVSLGDLPLEQLDGEGLRRALDLAGIRWRVIVISACHAGAFIDDLKDPGTIVLTAAAASKTSFGCSDDRDLTYFGEAFFRDALPAAPSLRAAFEMTRRLIAVREQREGVSPSDPQAWFGVGMERRWQPFEAAAASEVRALARTRTPDDHARCARAAPAGSHPPSRACGR